MLSPRNVLDLYLTRPHHITRRSYRVPSLSVYLFSFVVLSLYFACSHGHVARGTDDPMVQLGLGASADFKETWTTL